MNKPIIGILPDYSKKTVKEGGYANLPWYGLRMNYCHVITELGGIPLLLPYEREAIGDYLKTCDGLMFPGGDMDIHPSFYGEEITVKKINLNKDDLRTKFEFEILRSALKGNVPILGICAGFQALNVVLGGSLFQDIEEQVQTDIAHGSSSSGNTHSITVTEGSILHKITNKNHYIVNSYHHQTVKKIGKNLKISAVAPDGLIEAIEHESHPFCIGVEWHPEFQETDKDKKLFKSFIHAAEQYSRR